MGAADNEAGTADGKVGAADGEVGQLNFTTALNGRIVLMELSSNLNSINI